MSDLPFADRRHAGRVLAGRLARWRGRPGLLVLALPRGGVPVAAEVAAALDAPLDVLVVRKIGAPWQPEYAVGAIASGGIEVLQPEAAEVPAKQLRDVIAAERAELARRELLYRGDRPAPDVAGRSVLLVDDGLATGATMLAAARAVRQQGPALLGVAVPVCAASSCELLRGVADEVVCAAMPEALRAVGLWYRDFGQTTDGEVRALLQAARARHAARA